MSALCLAGGGALAQLALAAFTLAWTHSVERTGWQEDWRIEGQTLVLVEARVQGTGAGMEIPADAVRAHGWYRYRPNLAPLPALTLARSAEVPDWQLCGLGRCHPLADLVGEAPLVRLFPCASRAAGAPARAAQGVPSRGPELRRRAHRGEALSR